jgi:hypothetical protein
MRWQFCVAAYDGGYFKEEMAPVTVKVKGKEQIVDVDEHPRPQSTLEGLAKLPTVFKKDGVVTAGSSSVSVTDSRHICKCDRQSAYLYHIHCLLSTDLSCNCRVSVMVPVQLSLPVRRLSVSLD